MQKKPTKSEGSDKSHVSVQLIRNQYYKMKLKDERSFRVLCMHEK